MGYIRFSRLFRHSSIWSVQVKFNYPHRMWIHGLLGLCVSVHLLGCSRKTTTTPPLSLEAGVEVGDRVVTVLLPEGSLSKSSPGCERLMSENPLQFHCGCPVIEETILVPSSIAVVVTLECVRQAPTIEFAPFSTASYPKKADVPGATIMYERLKPTSSLSEAHTIIRGTVSDGEAGILSFECRDVPDCLAVVASVKW
jgi:hypothetical protein